MAMPPIDRTPATRADGAEAAASAANRVLPVAPVNPSVAVSPQATPESGVVNHISPALMAGKVPDAAQGDLVYTSVADPVRPKAEVVPTDWTARQPAAEKVEDPPRKAVYEVLMDNIKSVWAASASAVQIEQVKNQLNPPVATTPAQTPGELAKQTLNYQPAKIKKSERL